MFTDPAARRKQLERDLLEGSIVVKILKSEHTKINKKYKSSQVSLVEALRDYKNYNWRSNLGLRYGANKVTVLNLEETLANLYAKL